MDFVRYAEQCAALLNAPLDSLEELNDLLPTLGEHPPAQARDRLRLQTFLTQIRPAFEAGSAGRAEEVVHLLNAQLAKHPITQVISDHHDTGLHIHAASNTASVADQLISESLLGLATLVCELGPTRLGVCADDKCARAFVDTSPNQSRRYCSERCSSRANVAAYRARRKAARG